MPAWGGALRVLSRHQGMDGSGCRCGGVRPSAPFVPRSRGKSPENRWQQPALFTVEYAVARYLMALGIRPVAMAGHSLGELTALCLAGVYSLEDGFRIVNKRALCMDKAATMGLDPGVMAAVDAPLDLLQEMLKGAEQVYISNINSPNQVVLSGKTEAVKNFGNRLKEMDTGPPCCGSVWPFIPHHEGHPG